MNKILTIIVPTYNMEKYLDKCLTSLIMDDSELMRQLEVLVIIDGATDKSSEIAHCYEQNHPGTFRVIDKENGNYGSCINRGLKEATGKYVKVLDADDWFETDVLKDFIVFLDERDEDVIISAFNTVNNEGRTLWAWRYEFEIGKVFPIDAIAPTTMSMHAVTHKTNNLIINHYHQSEGISYTDTEWFYLPFAYANSFVYFDEPLYHYFIGREGQTVEQSTVAIRISQPIYIVERMIREFLTTDVDEAHKAYMRGCIERGIEFIYRIILVECNCKYNISLLAEFDEYLQTTDFYHCVDKYTYENKGYHYIKDWRRHGCKNSLSEKKIKYHSLKSRYKDRIKSIIKHSLKPFRK